MSFDPRVDPELQALLEEIAADPRARSFRGDVPVPRSLSCFDAGVLRESRTGLTLAERELLRVHREELAHLLLQASEHKLQQDPAMRARTSAYVSAERRRHFPDGPELIALLERSVRGMSAPSSPLTSTARTGLALLHSPASSAHQFAGLALRLVPQDASWIQIARALLVEGDPRASIALLTNLLSRRHDARLIGCAMEWVGVCFIAIGDARGAAPAFSRAARAAAPPPSSLLSWFVQSILACLEEESLRASGAVDSYLSGASPAVEAWREGLRARLVQGSTRTTPQVLDLARKLVGRVGPVSNSILEELTHAR